MTVLGIDYAWTRPSPAAIAKAGYAFACRYLSRDPSKNLTLTEAKALAAAGIWIVANWEYGAQDMLRGYAGGIADAQLALAQAKAAGMPDGRPIYFSADWAVTPAQMPAVLAYLSGAASVLGAADTGEYGGYAAVKAARDHGTVWTWQTFAWSGGAWDPRDTLRQTGSATVGGVQVDVNQAMTGDYGQWMPGVLPEGVTDVPLTDAEKNEIINGARDQVLNHPVGEVDLNGKATGATVTLGAITARSRAAQADLDARLAALTAAVAKLTPAAPVDAKALAAAVTTGLTPVVQQAVAAGRAPSADEIALAVEQHINAALAAALAAGK